MTTTLPRADNSQVSKAELLRQLKRAMLSDSAIADSDLAQTATQLVWGDGSPEARIMLIGEAPGAMEDKSGRPFVGQAGKLLDKCLDLVDLVREKDVWITNLVKYRPPANRDPSSAEKALYASYLDKEINIIQPQVIVTLGRHAGSHFIRDLQISRQHGHQQIVQRRLANGERLELLVMPFYHPAAALYNSHLLPILEQDFLNLVSIIKKNNNHNEQTSFLPSD